MAAKIKIIDRSPEFKRALAEESRKIMEEIGQQAAADMKQIVQVQRGTLQKSIESEVREEEKKLRLVVGASVRKGRLGYHAHLVEYGHDVYRRSPKKGGQKLGRTRAFPFVEPVGRWLKMEWPKRMRNLKRTFDRRFPDNG